MHQVICVRSSGMRLFQKVLPSKLNEHLEFSKQNRPARALFVDGLCVYHGHFSKEECSNLEKEFLGDTEQHHD